MTAAIASSYLVSMTDDTTIGLLEGCIVDIVSLYAADVVADKITHGSLFKGFRLRPNPLTRLAMVPSELLLKLQLHPFVADIRPSKIFTLPHWTQGSSSASLSSTENSSSADAGEVASAAVSINLNWGLDRIDQYWLPLDNVSAVRLIALLI